MHRGLINQRRTGIKTRPTTTTTTTTITTPAGACVSPIGVKYNPNGDNSLVSLLHLPKEHARSPSCPSSPFVLFLPDRALVLTRRLHTRDTDNNKKAKLRDNMALSVLPITLLEPLVVSIASLWHYSYNQSIILRQNGDTCGLNASLEKMEILCTSLYALTKTHVVPPISQYEQSIAISSGAILPSLRITACTRSLSAFMMDQLSLLKRSASSSRRELEWAVERREGLRSRLEALRRLWPWPCPQSLELCPPPASTTTTTTSSSNSKSGDKENGKGGDVGQTNLQIDYYNNTNLLPPMAFHWHGH